jgi:hypothetical protein
MNKLIKWLLLYCVIFGVVGCATPYDGMSPDNAIIQAVIERDLDSFERFLNKGANPNNPKLLERIVYQESWHGNGVTAMQLLVERGANLHAKYSNGAPGTTGRRFVP